MKTNTQWVHLGLLLLTAFIWGNAFVAQSVGAAYIGPFSFMAIRTWMAIIALSPLLVRSVRRTNLTKHDWKKLGRAGLLCGIFVFLGGLLQQIGIAYTTPAKAGFITALYMIFVPLVSVFFGKKPSSKLWLAVVLGLIGLYLLCIQGTLEINVGDVWILACAFAYTGQILCINLFVHDCHPILLSGMQFLVCAILSTLGMIFEPISWSAVMEAMPMLLYAGIFSTGVGYTLQIVAQQGLNPTVASLAMCTESVFSALAGWFWLHQVLSPSELAGCVLMFSAILITQIPDKKTAH